MEIADEYRMVERRDTGCRDSHQYLPVCDRWFWKLYELQRFITAKFLRSHCTHIGSPFSLVTPDLRRWAATSEMLMSIRDHQQIPNCLSPWPSSNTVDYCYNPHYTIRFVILIWSQIIFGRFRWGIPRSKRRKLISASLPLH